MPARKLWSVATTILVALIVGTGSPASAAPPGQRVEPADGGFQDRFGWSVAIDGRTAAVGAPMADVDGVVLAGAVYLFERQPGGGWQEVARLTSPDPGTFDDFGISVSLHRGTLAVGAVGDDDGAVNGGAVYVYQRTGARPGSWSLTSKLVPGDGRGGDFGCEVDLDRELLAVATCTTSGAEARAYLFRRRQRNPATWERARVFLAPTEGGFYGRKVAVSGDRLVIGAQLDDDVATQAGAVYVYERDAGGADNWGLTEKKTLDLPAFSGFGGAVDLEGDRMLVGAPGFAGAAFVLEREAVSGEWIEVASLESPDDSDGGFGSSVALDGDRALVGAPDVDLGQFSAGAAYLFERDAGGSGAWGRTRELLSTDRDAFEAFGFSVALWRGLLVVADPLDDVGTTQVGSVHFY